MLSGRIAVRREAGSQVFILLAICSVLVPLLGTLGAGSRLWRSIEIDAQARRCCFARRASHRRAAARCRMPPRTLRTCGRHGAAGLSHDLKNLLLIMHSGTRIVEHRGFCERAGGALILESVPAKGTSAGLWLPAVPC